METRLKLGYWIAELRIHHWVKNILVFIPAIANHSILEKVSILSGLKAFIAFSLTASCIYLLNDLLDIDSDRKHPVKRFRPLAAGHITKTQALLASIILLTLASSLVYYWNLDLILVLALYFVLNINYSLYLKKIPILDVVVLAVMYELRIVGGGIAADIQLSTWLISSSAFLFLSMALAKRYTELLQMSLTASSINSRRGYFKGDLSLIQTLGVVCSFNCVLIFNLYINDPDTLSMYSKPKFLLLLLPIVTYIFAKKWLDVNRNHTSEDPIVDFFSDKSLLLLIPIFLVVIFMAL